MSFSEGGNWVEAIEWFQFMPLPFCDNPAFRRGASRHSRNHGISRHCSGVGKCPYYWGCVSHHQTKYLLEIIFPIIGWCLIVTFTNPGCLKKPRISYPQRGKSYDMRTPWFHQPTPMVPEMACMTAQSFTPWTSSIYHEPWPKSSTWVSSILNHLRCHQTRKLIVAPCVNCVN